MLHCGSCSGTKSSAAEQLFVERAAQGEGHVHHVGEQLPAEQRPHAPQPECRRPLGAFHRPHAAVVLGQTGCGRIEQVGCVLAEGLETVALRRGRRRRRRGPARRASCGRPRPHCPPVPGRPPGGGAGRSSSAAPPWAASTCSQTSWRRQTSAMSSSGSKAPVGVAQAHATTATIGWFRARSRVSSSSSRRGSMRPRSSSPTRTICRLPRPRMPAARATL